VFRIAAALGVCLSFSAFSVFARPPFKPEQYAEVQLKALQTQPEEYKNKKICYVSKFQKAMTTFPAYAERNGIKAGKYFWLLIPPLSFPVVVKKSDDMNALVMALKSGSSVKVYGKVRKFTIAPGRTMLPRYYLDLVQIEVLSQPDASSDDGAKKPVRPPRRRPKR
jgi:hypothetical protein